VKKPKTTKKTILVALSLNYGQILQNRKKDEKTGKTTAAKI